MRTRAIGSWSSCTSCWQGTTVDPYPPGYHGTRCGMGALAFVFGMMLFGVLALISLIVFATRES